MRCCELKSLDPLTNAGTYVVTGGVGGMKDVVDVVEAGVAKFWGVEKDPTLNKSAGFT